MLIILFVFAISDTMEWGFYSLNKVLIVIIPFYALIVFNIKRALLIYLMTILAYLVIGILTYENVIENSTLLLERVSSIPVWIESALLLSCASLIVVEFTRGYNKAVGELVVDLREKNKDLVEREKNLTEKNERLSEYAFINSHMMRAPLSRLLSLADVVSNEVTIPNQQKIMTNFKTSAMELDQIVRAINDVLDKEKDLNREVLIESLQKTRSK